MTTFTFQALASPFLRWWGPYSPSRGDHSGFRFHHNRPGTWVGNQYGQEFWPIVDSPSARALTAVVQDHWSGGRILLLPNGLVIKPLQHDDEVSVRVIIGFFSGPVVLEQPGGGVFDLSNPGTLAPGDPWPGPKTIGIECNIQADGSLDCSWYFPTTWGRDEVQMQVCGPDTQMAQGFKKARPASWGGRVRVTANGHVFTNRKEWDGTWISLYVGRIVPESWRFQPEWIGKEYMT